MVEYLNSYSESSLEAVGSLKPFSADAYWLTVIWFSYVILLSYLSSSLAKGLLQPVLGSHKHNHYRLNLVI